MFLRALARLSVALLALPAIAQQTVTIPLPDGHASIQADIYGSGNRGIVLAHGGRFGKERWAPQARVLAEKGFTVLAVQFRGDKKNPDGSTSAEGPYEDNAADVLAAVRYLHSMGMRTVSAIGGSLGGDAVGDADAQSNPGEFDRVVFLGSEGGSHPEQLKGRKLYLVARNDTSGDGPRLPGIKAHYAKAPQPKKLVIVNGSAHAQYLFGTDEGPQVLDKIVKFITQP
ncbi:MAG: alpha/beta fold hydrolase [Terracidiphilus sp.]|jgi:dienelactone hydrolase